MNDPVAPCIAVLALTLYLLRLSLRLLLLLGQNQ